MAQKVRLELISDLSGETGEETVQFSIDGISYEIDLTSKEAGDLRKALEPYSKAGRRIGGRRQSGGGSRRRSSANSGIDLAEAREWIKKNTDFKVSDRGRIKQQALDAYKKAHGIA